MSNSSLISITKLSPNCASPRTHVIDSVAIHVMAGDMTVESCGNHFANPSVRASSNYGIGSDGRIGLYVDEGDRSWCTSSRGVDDRSVTIEIANTEAKHPWPISAAAYQSLITLLVDICRRNHISSLRWIADEVEGKRAAAGGSVDKQNIFVHRWFAAKTCPGQYVYERLGAIANAVNVQLAAGGELGSVPSGSATTGATGVTPQFPMDFAAIKPYVIILDRASKISESELGEMTRAGVVGALVEAGYSFTSTGQRVSRFSSPAMHNQVMLLNSLHIPHGFYLLGRAHNTREADIEMTDIAAFVRTLPPALGVWIRTEFPSANITRNNLIIDKYYKELIRLGLIRKVGLVANDDLLRRFDWQKHKDRWYLLYENHISSTAELGGLLTPEFFELRA